MTTNTLIKVLQVSRATINGNPRMQYSSGRDIDSKVAASEMEMVLREGGSNP
jgi:hypothetical protein